MANNLPFDKNLVGRRIAVGGEHRVYNYDKRFVIKFPFGPRYWLNAQKYCDNLKRDEEITRQYFGEYLVEREIKYYNKNNKSCYVIIEPKITGRHLERADLEKVEIRNQLQGMVEINQKLAEHENLSAEFFGLRGLIYKGNREVSNIMLEKASNKLFLIDAGIMHFGKHKDQQTLIDLVTRWAMKKQERLLRFYLKS